MTTNTTKSRPQLFEGKIRNKASRHVCFMCDRKLGTTYIPVDLPGSKKPVTFCMKCGSRVTGLMLRSREPVLEKIDEALGTLIHAWFNDEKGGISFDDHNDTIWLLLRTVCEARGVVVPEELPEEWP